MKITFQHPRPYSCSPTCIFVFVYLYVCICTCVYQYEKSPSGTLDHIPADRLYWSFPDINHLPRLFAQPEQFIQCKSESESNKMESEKKVKIERRRKSENINDIEKAQLD